MEYKTKRKENVWKYLKHVKTILNIQIMYFCS